MPKNNLIKNTNKKRTAQLPNYTTVIQRMSKGMKQEK